MIDLSDNVLAFARRNFEMNASRPDWQVNTRFDKGDALQLPYSDSSFDVVMSFGLLEHFSAIENPIAEQMRVLRPDLFLADIVTARFSVDSIGHFPALVKKKALNLLHRDQRILAASTENDFFENRIPLQKYVATVEKSDGRVILPWVTVPSPRLAAFRCSRQPCWRYPRAHRRKQFGETLIFRTRSSPSGGGRVVGNR